MKKDAKRTKRPGLVFLGLFVLAAVLMAAETFVVKVRTTSLRSTPKFYAQAVVGLNAGDGLEKVAEQGDWIQVRTAAGVTGWVHRSALEPKKFTLLAMDKSLKSQATAEEVALASKGFNKQVEDSYKSRNKSISFAEVDRMLLLKIPASEVEAFLKKGKLAEFGGAK